MTQKPSPSGIREIAIEISADEVAEQFKPYALELGAFVYGWNQLHDDLAGLFWGVIGGVDGSVPLAIWHSNNSDRSQRQMLRAAATAKFSNRPQTDRESKRKNDQLLERFKWLLTEVDKLGIYRNDVIHAPYWFISGPGPMELIPNVFLGNPRAKGLGDKELLNTFRWCRQTASVLSRFTNSMAVAVNNYRDLQPAWPEIPQLPNRGDKKSPKENRQRNRPR